MSEKEKYSPPEPSRGDKGHAVAKGVLGAIPYAGAAASELLNLIVMPPLEKRRLKWMEEIGEGLRKLEEKTNLSIAELQDKDEFIDVVMEATRIVLKTSQKEKREALKSAVLNTANNSSPEESLRMMFLSFIDTLTEWHLKLLKLFDDPEDYLEKTNVRFGNLYAGGLDDLLEAVFPELKDQRQFYDLIWSELFGKALVTTNSLHGMMSGSGIKGRRTTEIGRSFLQFITSPIEE